MDGLRALAVLLVMAGHANMPKIERAGGPIGVTTFFVLSGYFITGMLISEFGRTGRLDLRNFYWKRFARLAPALVVMVVVTTAVGLVLGQGRAAVRDAVASLLYVSNWAQAYLQESVPQLSITWSLSVEEQYYLLWPLLLLPLLRRPGRGRLLVAMCVVWLGSLVLRVVLAEALPVGVVYRLVSFNAFPLVSGGVLAALLSRPLDPGGKFLGRARRRVMVSPRLRNAAVFVLSSLLVFLAAYPYVMPGKPQIWVGLPVTALTAAIIWVASAGPCVVLGWAPIAWVGRISYSLYLWHISFMEMVHLPYFFAWPASFLVAAASWRFVEGPGQRFLLARRGWRRRGGWVHPAPRAEATGEAQAPSRSAEGLGR